MAESNLKFDINSQGYLRVSYNSGCTWELIGKVVGGASTVAGPTGPKGDKGDDGENGKNGKDGITPHIDKTTKHWMLEDEDTGVIAEGKDMGIDIAVSSDIAEVGTPSITKTVTGNTCYLYFHQLKGESGETHSITVEQDEDDLSKLNIVIDGKKVASINNILYQNGTYISIEKSTEDDTATVNCTLAGKGDINIDDDARIDIVSHYKAGKKRIVNYHHEFTVTNSYDGKELSAACLYNLSGHISCPTQSYYWELSTSDKAYIPLFNASGANSASFYISIEGLGKYYCIACVNTSNETVSDVVTNLPWDLRLVKNTVSNYHTYWIEIPTGYSGKITLIPQTCPNAAIYTTDGHPWNTTTGDYLLSNVGTPEGDVEGKRTVDLMYDYEVKDYAELSDLYINETRLSLIEYKLKSLPM